MASLPTVQTVELTRKHQLWAFPEDTTPAESPHAGLPIDEALFASIMNTAFSERVTDIEAAHAAYVDEIKELRSERDSLKEELERLVQASREQLISQATQR